MKQMFINWPSMIYGIILGFCLGVMIVLLTSCSSDDLPAECEASQDRCNELVRKMDQSTGTEKETFRQLYLTEKHNLEGCIKQHQ